MLAENIVEFSVAEGEVLVHFLVLLFGNFLPLLRDYFHNLFRIQLRPVLFNNLSPFLREEQVWAQRFPRRLHICFDLLLFLLNVGFLEATVLLIPKLALLALLEGLELGLRRLQIVLHRIQIRATIVLFANYWLFVRVCLRFRKFVRVRFRIPDLNLIEEWSLLTLGGTVFTDTDLYIICSAVGSFRI